jgi:hypothetical protein
MFWRGHILCFVVKDIVISCRTKASWFYIFQVFDHDAEDFVTQKLLRTGDVLSISSLFSIGQ